MKLSEQKKRRLMRATHTLHDEDLVQLLREGQNQRTNGSNSEEGQNGEVSG